ncbi:MAG: WYL domain-containing protein [Bdellovibrionales bacterium]|nr:WYL domain-containing protein [Bdellovibrionales bacterium]
MFTDGSSFFRRATLFQQQLFEESFPSAGTLAKLARCSRNTAQRTIDRLRDEYGVPIAYDASKKGYYLTEALYEFPTLCAGKDELVCLLLMRNLTECIDDENLRKNIDTLWLQFVAARNANVPKLEEISNFFSSNLTSTGAIVEAGVLDYLYAASSGAEVTIGYKSPWRHKEVRTYRGQLQRVHLSDGTLYLLFEEAGTKREITLNASFVRSFSRGDTVVENPVADPGPWSEGFGVWLGTPVQEIVVRISAPAAEYYASKLWHEEQVDTWEGTTLVRKLPSSLSPELVARIVSIGEHIQDIEPAELKDMVRTHLARMLGRLAPGDGGR